MTKPDNWKKGVILAGAAIGGLLGCYHPDTQHPLTDIALGVVFGAFVAGLVWDFAVDQDVYS